MILNYTEIERFHSWLRDYHEQDVIDECSRLVEEMQEQGQSETELTRSEIVAQAIQNVRKDELHRGAILETTPCVSTLPKGESDD